MANAIFLHVIPGMLKATAAVLCLFLLTGCIPGTRATRTSESLPNVSTDPHSFFGGHPFQAVVVDFQIELGGGNKNGHPLEPIVNLGLDLLIDLVLAPIDLVAWPFGCHKRGLRS